MYDLMQSLNKNGTQTNDLEAFKRYLDNPDSEIHQYLTSIQYAYDLSLPVYTKDADGNIVKADVMELLQNMMSSMYGGDYSSYFHSSAAIIPPWTSGRNCFRMKTEQGYPRF